MHQKPWNLLFIYLGLFTCACRYENFQAITWDLQTLVETLFACVLLMVRYPVSGVFNKLCRIPSGRGFMALRFRYAPWSVAWVYPWVPRLVVKSYSFRPCSTWSRPDSERHAPGTFVLITYGSSYCMELDLYWTDMNHMLWEYVVNMVFFKHVLCPLCPNPA